MVMFIFSTLQMNEPDMEILNELAWDANVLQFFSFNDNKFEVRLNTVSHIEFVIRSL